MAKSFQALVDKNRRSSLRTPRKADEDVLPAEETTNTPADTPEVDMKDGDVVIPEGSTEIEGIIYVTPEGDLTIVPNEPLTIEGLDEPVTQLDIEIHTEENEEAPAETPEPAELNTEVPDEVPEEANMDMTQQEASALMASLNDANVGLLKAGTEENPSWIVLKNGSVFAAINYADQAHDAGVKAFFASDTFPTQVLKAATSIGWNEALPRMNAKLYTQKGITVAPATINAEAMKAEWRQTFFNDMQTAYGAMLSRMRTNPMAAKLYDATIATGMAAPEVFVAEVLKDEQGAFISALFDAAVEINTMSPQVKEEFRKLIARNQVSVPTPTATYQPDLSFQQRLASGSMPVASAAVSTEMPSGSRFGNLGLLN
jgi:hypothetical protein